MNQSTSPSDKPVKRARVLLADDHPYVNEALKRILSTEFDVVGTVEDGVALLRAVPELTPDVIVLDVSMPELDGFSALQHLKNSGSDAKVILISAFHEPSFVKIAMDWGASGFILKHSAFDELIPAVRTALDGGIYNSSFTKTKAANTPRL
jgi:DNA-binding NarL/FixJ family response regulator